MIEPVDKFFADHTVIENRLMQVTAEDVERSLAKTNFTQWDLINFLSPAAEDYLEEMAQRAYFITRQRFGKTMKLYAPLYVSNICTNRCVYCGFNETNTITRRTLTIDEVEEQAAFLTKKGFQNLLLVSGESRKEVPVGYLEACIKKLKPNFPEISIEVYPLETDEYARLEKAGLHGLIVYQETYQEDIYKQMHLAGRKKDYHYRLATPARGAQAGLRQIGLGVLLGLADFRIDAFYLGMHAKQLEKRYWKSSFGLSFPRMTKAAGGFVPPSPVSDVNLVQMVTALRLFLPDAPFSLSTRESQKLRTDLLPLGFTQMSAGSCTEPGGYGQAESDGNQFQVEDTRSVEEIAKEVALSGLEPVWKDWDGGFSK